MRNGPAAPRFTSVVALTAIAVIFGSGVADLQAPINLTGRWSTPQFGEVELAQALNVLTLKPLTERVFQGTFTGNRLELFHPLTYEETRRDLPEQVRQALVRRHETLIVRGRVRPDGDTISVVYYDKFPEWDKKTFEIKDIKERPVLTTAMFRKVMCKPESDALQNELPAAQATLDRSHEIARSLAGKKSGLAYWFGELYVYITDFEVAAAPSFAKPGFLLHFIPIFYDMYAENAELYAGDNANGIAKNWQRHFTISSVFADPYRQKTQFVTDATSSLVSGVQAHIQGDMARALEDAYESYSRKYCNVPALDTYKTDFFEVNRPIFEKVKTSFLNEFINLGIFGGSKSIDPNTAAKAGDAMKMGLNVDEVYRWREDAWQKAKRQIESR